MKKILPIVFASLALLASHAQAASFDCGKARIKTEQLICSEETLSKLDDELDAAYRLALSKANDKARLKLEQADWLKVRNDPLLLDWVNALVNLYRDRIANLRHDAAHPAKGIYEPWLDVPRGSLKPARTLFKIERSALEADGPRIGICEALVRWTNHTQPEQKIESVAQLVRSMPGVAEPEWVALSIDEHRNLFNKMVTFLKWDKFFERMNAKAARTATPEKAMPAIPVQEMLMLMTKAPMNLASMIERKSRVMVSLRYVYLNPEGVRDLLESVSFVRDDLSDIDAETTAKYGASTGWASALVYFKGEPYLVTPLLQDGLMISSRATYGICFISTEY